MIDKHDIKQLADECYPSVTVGSDLETTAAQRRALFRKWKQNDQAMTWPEFALSVWPVICADGAITVRWNGMWLCIERDGHVHT